MKKDYPAIAKITRPTLPDIFPRQRLFKLMDRGLRFPVTWITGPPGSGKTTLVASYIDNKRLPCIWYQVDEGDGDIATFFYYLGMAARKAAPRIKQPLPLLTPEYQFGIPTFTRRYFEDLFSRLKPPASLVFDNYQDAPEGSAFHETVVNGLSVLPPGIAVYIVSRTGPPLNFTRMQANSGIFLIGWEQLQLTPEETSGVMRLRTGKPQSKDSARLLHEKTQGWAAGIVLMEALQAAGGERNDPATMELGKLSDYFAGEIFGKLSEDTREFLLRTSFLPRFDPAMAEAITGNKRAAQILAELNHRNYFTERRSEPEAVYQYHALFQEFLQNHVQKVLRETERSRLRIEAASLLQQAGFSDDAVDAYQEAGAWDRFLPLVLSRAHALLNQGRSRTLKKWLVSLPESIKTANPWVLYWLGMCDIAFHPQQSQTLLEEAFILFDNGGDEVGRLLAWSGAADTAVYSGEFAGLGEWLKRIDGVTVEDVSRLELAIAARVILSIFNAMAFGRPDHPDLHLWTKKITDIFYVVQDVNINFRVQAGVNLGKYYVWTGNFINAQRVLDFLNDLCRRKDISDLSVLSVLAHNALHGCTTGDVGLALKSMESALQLANASGVHVWDELIICHVAVALLGAKDLQGAKQLLDKISIRPGMTRRFDHAYYLSLRAWSLLEEGNASAAYEYVPTYTALFNEAGHWAGIGLGPLLPAEILIVMGDYAKAEQVLHDGYRHAQRVGSKYLEYGYLFVTAQLELARGKRDRCKKLLAEAFAIGREQRFWYHFNWRPALMARLCVEALEMNVETNYVRELIRRNKLVPEAPPLHIKDWPWPLRIFTLGKFEVLKDDEPLGVSKKTQKKPLQLLKALIALGGKDVKEDRLADALWPDAEGDAGLKAVNVNTLRLRKLLGSPEAIIVREGTLTLNPRTCWVDAWGFEAAVEGAESARREEEGAKGKSAIRDPQFEMEKALSLYRGLFLADDPESWSVQYREKLRDRVLRCVDAIGRRMEESERCEEALRVYQRGLDVDDLAETYYQRMMSCHMRLGRRAEALAVYNRCRKTLAVYGVEPSEETESLRRSLHKS